MMDLFLWQYIAIGLVFIWSGFVRSGLGFGGAVLALPFLLLIHNDPLVYLPVIAIHLLIFSSWIAIKGHRQSKKQAKLDPDSGQSNIDWAYLKKSLGIMIVPKLIGVFGLLTLPSNLITGIIFGIVIFFAISYILDKPFKSNNKWLDNVFLMMGGYVSGTSLIGAPLIVAVYATHVARHQLRDTLFVLWFILVMIKMVSFLIAGIDLQLIHQIWLLPCAFIGHLLGQKFHNHIQAQDSKVFFRVLGFALLVICIIGLYMNFIA